MPTIHYKLRGKQQDQPIEREGTLTEEQLAGVKLDQDSALINVAIRNLHAQGTIAEWEECTLEDTDTHQEQIYLLHKKRWTNRANIHTRR